MITVGEVMLGVFVGVFLLGRLVDGHWFWEFPDFIKTKQKEGNEKQ